MPNFYVELRHEADSRILRGTAMPYGQVAKMPWGKERFEPGAFGDDVESLDVILNVQHERGQAIARTGGGGLVLEDSPEALRIRAELPNTREADDTLARVRARILRGFSVEFRAIRERFEGDTRIIDQAALVNIGIVDRPAYDQDQAYIEARAREYPGAQKQRQWIYI